jgi:hypothetical protein
MKCKTLSLTVLVLSIVFALGCKEEDEKSVYNPLDMDYKLVINPANFETTNIVGNTYFPIVPGMVQVFQGAEEDGEVLRVESRVLAETRMVAGVTCAVFQVTEYEDGELTEETLDWYAQDLHGNVWYFGEEVKNYEDGAFVDNAGSWEAGVDGALPGLFMLANPVPSMWYRQEYRACEAEDVALVREIGVSVTVGGVAYHNCLVTAEWNPLEPGVLEYDYYAPGIGAIKEESVEGESDYIDLIEHTVP